MYFKLTLSVLLFAYVSTSDYVHMDISPILAQQQYVTGLMLSTFTEKDGTRVSNEVAQQCFVAFNKIQSSIDNTYNREYLECISTAEAAKQNVTIQSDGKRNETLERGNALCKGLDDCDSHVDGIEFFNCYSSVSSANTETLYTLSRQTAEEAESLTVLYQAITNNQNICNNACLDKYVSNTATSNKEREKCLKGETPPPIWSTTTSTTELTTEPTTELTTEPTTEEPRPEARSTWSN